MVRETGEAAMESERKYEEVILYIVIPTLVTALYVVKNLGFF